METTECIKPLLDHLFHFFTANKKYAVRLCFLYLVRIVKRFT